MINGAKFNNHDSGSHFKGALDKYNIILSYDIEVYRGYQIKPEPKFSADSANAFSF